MSYLFTGLLILLVAACTSAWPPHNYREGGRPHRRFRQVVGGTPYNKGDYPFIVSLWYMGGNNPFTANTPGLHHTCGGSLVHESWVLTSASCFDDAYLPGLSNTSMWKVYLGMHHQTDAEDEGQLRFIQQVFKVPEYNFLLWYGDLALLKLDRPATLDSLVSVVKINSMPECPQEQQEVEVIGWGQVQNHKYGLGSDYPSVVTINNIPLDECQRQYSLPEFAAYGEIRIDERNLCTGVMPNGGKDACYGDSGSPMLARCGNDVTQVIVGTLSYGNGCAIPRSPTVYTKVSSYYDWLVETMRNNP